MKAGNITKRILIALLTLAMTVAYMPADVFAEPLTEQADVQTEAAAPGSIVDEAVPEGNTDDEAASEGIADAPEETEPEEPAADEKPADEVGEDAAFPKKLLLEAELDGVIVKIESEEGAFPDDAVLVVNEASKIEEAEAGEAIDDVRPDDLNVADSRTFDIKVLDAAGNELQPADGHKVNISFSMDRALDRNLTADIYHITENEVINENTRKPETILEAEKLESETNAEEASVSAETDGFSLYTIEFTYSAKTYIAKNSGSAQNTVSLQDIIDNVGLAGTAESARTDDANAAFFTINNDKTVTFLQAFNDEKELIISVNNTVGGTQTTTDYVINVKNCVFSKEADSWEGLQSAIDSSNNGDIIVLVSDITCGNDKSIKADGKNVTIDLNGYTMDRSRSSSDGDGHVINVKGGAALTIRDSSDAGTGTLTGGYATDGGGIKIEKDSTCNIESGTISGNKASKDGAGIYVWGTLNMTGGVVMDNEAGDNGGGIYVEDTGTLDLDGVTISNNTSKNGGGGMKIHLKSDGAIKNSIITGNKTTNSDGGGFYLNAKNKTLTLVDTYIDNNTAADEGGGIYVEKGTNEMTGGSLSGNTSEDGGGVYNDGGTLTFERVTISENKATKYGGAGINNKSAATIYSCTIKDNTAAAGGAGVYAGEDIRMESCTFTNNTSRTSGGAIQVNDCTAVLSDCSMSGNIANNYGGAICVSEDGGIEILRGSITSNTAYKGGGGIWVGSNGRISIGGVMKVRDNAATDIYLTSGRIMTITAPLKSDNERAQIGVVLQNQKGVFTSGYSDNNQGDDPYDYFVPDAGCSVMLDNNEARIITSLWGNLQHKINIAEDGEVISLDRNIKAQSDDNTLTIPAGKNITINLNGFTLDRGLGQYKESGEVVTVDGTLTIVDPKGDGKITGGFGAGGGVCVRSGGSFTLKGGSISGNKGNQYGGGILVCEGGSAAVSGGKVESNNAPYGGGIYSSGDLTIQKGTEIKSNTASKSGGGIYVDSGVTTVNAGDITGNSAAIGGGAYIAGGTLRLEGGSVTGNSASDEAGGIWHGDDSAGFNVKGAPVVKDNTATIGMNVLLRNSKNICLTGSLTTDAESGANAAIDLMTDDVDAPLTDGLDATKPEGSEAAEYAEKIFTFNGTSYETSLEIKNGELCHKSTGVDDWVSSWKALQDYVNDRENSGKTVGLTEDIDASGQDYSIKVDGDKISSVTIDLNGHVMDRKRTSDDGDGHVFNVKNGGTLTVRDSIGTGVLTGGNATDGGGIKIEKDSVCVIEGGTIKGNKADKDGAGIYVWGKLNMTGGIITGNYADDNGGGIYVEDTGTIDLDNVLISSNTSKNGGGGLNIHLKADGSIRNSTIKDNRSNDSDGGGLSMDADGRTLTVDNTVIEGNYADDEGGGIYLDSGTLKMTGGELSGNSGNDAGGIMVTSRDVFTADGVTVSGNESRSESGGGVNNKGDTTLRNCTVSNNRASNDAGGGVYNKSHLAMESCSLSANTASTKGGALFSKSAAAIKDCTFDSNTADQGGGIYHADGNMTLTDSVMTNNTGNDTGGAIYADSDMTVDGGSITGNSADFGGSGIYVEAHVQYTVTVTEPEYFFTVKGALTVKDNLRDNIYLESFNYPLLEEKLTVGGSLEKGDQKAEIGITLEDKTGTFTYGYKEHHTDPSTGSVYDCADYFSADGGYSVINNEYGEGMIVESGWTQLQKLINDTAAGDNGSGDPPVLTLQKDWKALDMDSSLKIPAGKRIIIDLSGHTIDRNLQSKDANGHVFVIEQDSSLTIRDTSDARTGTITGGWADKGGAFYLEEQNLENCQTVLNIEGGNITGNKAYNGGAVYAHRSNDVNEVVISISGGSISGNEATNGGAIYLAEDDSHSDHTATVNITGGIITGNSAAVEGGAIWAGEKGVVNVSGKPFVKGNDGAVGKNILLGAGNVLNITDELIVESGNTGGKIDTAALDLLAKNGEGEGGEAKLTSGLAAGTPAETSTVDHAKSIFTYNGQSYDNALEVKGSELYQKNATSGVNDWISDWAALQTYVNDPQNNGKTVGLTKDIDASGEDYSIKVDGSKTGSVTIELNGHKMDRKRSSSTDDGHVINVKNGAVLTVKDSVGTGIITGGNTSEGGGGIKIEKDSTCRIEGGTICGNKAKPDGGGIYVKGILEMSGGSVSDNSANDTGGGIYCTDSGTFKLKNATISGNTAENDGGGLIVHLGSDASITDCRIINNTSTTEDGGGMRVEAKNRTLTITDTEISGNNAENDGGGMVIYAGTVAMTRGSISGNTSEDGAGIYNDGGTIEFNGVKIDGNTSVKKSGGGINNGSTATLTDCEITNNVSSADGGGIYAKKAMTITRGLISGNSATEDGGGIFNTDDGTVINGTEISGNKADKDGGAIFTDNDMTLTSCTLKENTVKVSGGAIRVKDCMVTLEKCTIIDNNAGNYGGGIYIDDGSAKLMINAGTIKDNFAGVLGSGMYVDDGTDDVFISGIVDIYNNLGSSDVYLTEGKKLEVTGPLYSGGDGSAAFAQIGVGTVEGLEKAFTSDYRKYNEGIEPAEIFFSNDDYDVYLKDGEEAAFRRSQTVDDLTPFIEKNSQMVKKYNTLSGKNWMSGISGERYLHEINIPGTHDSCTKKMEGNTSTGTLTNYVKIADLIPVILVVDFFMDIFTGDNIAQKVADYMAKFSVTQRRYVNEQLDDGIRSLDLRVNTYYSKAGSKKNRHDDGKNLWVLHGKDKKPGSFFAKKEDGGFLSLNDVFGYCKEFLTKHPTETIVVDVAIQGIDVDEEKALARLNDHIRALSQELNPSTGESFLYMEGGDYSKVLDHYPQLKDCRGKIVLMGDTVGKGSGGLNKGAGLRAVYGPEGDYHDNSEQKIKHLRDFYAIYGHDPLPVDANDGNPSRDSYYSVGTNCTDSNSIPSVTPLEYADEVLPVLFDEGGLLTDRQSMYLGLVNMDAANSKNNRQVWITNFGTLEYRTVTVKAGEDDQNPNTYTVLSKTPIIIQDCIYADPNDRGDYFQYWKATDKDGTFIGNYYPDDPFTVTQDVIFTAVWEKTDSSSIRAVWNDANDADGKRPTRFNVTVTKNKSSQEGGDSAQEIEEKTIELTADNKVWRKELDFAPVSVTVKPENMPAGYTADIKGTKIILTHVPTKSVTASGKISWNDNNDEAGKRPDSVMLYLYKDGTLYKTCEARAGDDWDYKFENLLLYEEKNGKIKPVTYTLGQDEIEDYSAYISGLGSNGFIIKNTLKSSSSMIEGAIVWVDEDDSSDKRPKEVTVRLSASGNEISSLKVSKDSDGNWLFSFPMDPQKAYSEYSVAIDSIEGYDSTVNMGNSEGDLVFIINRLSDHQHAIKEISEVTKDPTCTEAGERVTMEICTTCGEVVSNKKEAVDPLGHDWGKWNDLDDNNHERVCGRNDKHAETAAHDWESEITKAATEDEEGLMTCTCKDCGRKKTEVIPKAPHVHQLQEVKAVAATCTADGTKAYYECKKCHQMFTDAEGKNQTTLDDLKVNKLGHSYAEVAGTAKAPTCTTKGKEADKKCSRCEDLITGAEIAVDPSAHALEAVAAVAPTCEQGGNIAYWECSRCHKKFTDAEGKNETTDVTAKAAGHTPGEVKKENEVVATCTKKGSYEEVVFCSVCKKEISRTTKEIAIDPDNHNAVTDPAVPATCTATGLTEGSHCSECNAVLKAQQVTGMIDHDWGEWIVDASSTCSKTGVKHRVCKICGFKDNDAQIDIDPNVHEWEDHYTQDKVPTCVTEGSESIHCKNCVETKDSRVIDIDPSAHALEAVAAVAPTCEHDGNIAYWECIRCHKKFTDAEGRNETTDVVIKATGHSWNDGVVTTEPKVGEKGVKTYTCKNCGATRTEEIAALLDIKNTWVTVAKATYTGKKLKPKIKVVFGSETLKEGTDFTATYRNNTKAGNKASVIIAGIGRFGGERKVTFSISKAKKNLVIKRAKKLQSARSSKKKRIKHAVRIRKNPGKGTLTYRKVSGSKKISVSRKGVITVRKGLKAGKIYRVKIKVTSKATANYKSASRTVVVKIKIRK